MLSPSSATASSPLLVMKAGIWLVKMTEILATR